MSETVVNKLQITDNFDEMMSGELLYTIDSKGRMSFPQCFRDVIGDKFKITKGVGSRLVARSIENWNQLVRRIYALPEGKNKEILNQRFVKCAATVETDKLGRILIPQALREHAKLVKDIYVVGAMDAVEIWDKSEYIKSQDVSDEEIYAATKDLG